jgi:hypothetical protein
MNTYTTLISLITQRLARSMPRDWPRMALAALYQRQEQQLLALKTQHQTQPSVKMAWAGLSEMELPSTGNQPTRIPLKQALPSLPRNRSHPNGVSQDKHILPRDPISTPSPWRASEHMETTLCKSWSLKKQGRQTFTNSSKTYKINIYALASEQQKQLLTSQAITASFLKLTLTTPLSVRALDSKLEKPSSNKI